MNGISLHMDEHPSADDLRQILDGCAPITAPQSGTSGLEQSRVFCEMMKGGLSGEHMPTCGVAESQRGKGFGSALLRAVEDYAATNGFVLAYLETTSFQARPFYESLGYQVFSELVGIDEGCTLFFLQKDLQAPATEAVSS